MELATLLLLLCMQLKHLAADFLLQPSSWARQKHRYLSLPAMYHAGLHGLLTLLLLLLFSIPVTLIAVLVLLDILAHFHIDYVKSKVDKKMQKETTDAEYWWVFGSDQALHHITHITIVWLAVTRS